MKNWAGNIKWSPASVAYPETEGAIQELVAKAVAAGKKIRVIGSGHSFTALCPTHDILISLDKYQGLLFIDKNRNKVTVKAGTKLHLLGALLFKEGLAMENMGDIDAQSIAGTISTGTHGTGKTFGTISTQVTGLQFINGKGELVKCSTTNQPELFRAAQVSLGALGIITAVTIQCVPAYKLALQNRRERVKDVLATLDERNANNRNFEYYWLPYTEYAWTKTTNLAPEDEPDKVNFWNYWTEYFLENYTFKAFCEFARFFPSQNERVSKITAASINSVKKVYHSHKVYATKRLVKFAEMEYNIPVDAYPDVWKEVMKKVNNHKFNIHFPIENRWVKRDDILLSPAFGRDSAYIAFHVYHKKDYRPYFKAIEDIFKAFGGRPHWGKIHSLTASELINLYPAFSTFLKHQREQDPQQIFINDYLKQLFGY